MAEDPRLGLAYYHACHEAWGLIERGLVRPVELDRTLTRLIDDIGADRARELHARWAETWRRTKGRDPWSGQEV